MRRNPCSDLENWSSNYLILPTRPITTNGCSPIRTVDSSISLYISWRGPTIRCSTTHGRYKPSSAYWRIITAWRSRKGNCRDKRVSYRPRPSNMWQKHWLKMTGMVTEKKNPTQEYSVPCRFSQKASPMKERSWLNTRKCYSTSTKPINIWNPRRYTAS